MLALLAPLALLALAAAVEFQVMMPLTTVDNSGTLSNSAKIQSQLRTLRDAGVDSVMIDVWWGIVEKTEGSYDFRGYREFFDLATEAGLKVSPVMSFHRCGGNVGDDCDIPLPTWVQNAADSKDLWYMDYWGNSQREYIALSADEARIGSRTVLQIYRDFMDAFASYFSYFFASGWVREVQVGLGPCGELRYPSYPSNLWSFPGVGAFQCFNPEMLADFRTKAAAAGHPEWTSPPTDAGSYNSRPEQTAFFTSGYTSEYGRWFLDWYSSLLLEHAERVMGEASAAFASTGVALVAKVAGIHWWYGTSHHAAELTAGYYNTNGQNAYLAIAERFRDLGAVFDFTCLEMRDSEQDSKSYCKPQELVAQVEEAVQKTTWRMSGENALERYDRTAYQTVLDTIKKAPEIFENFTYLRLTDALVGTYLNDFKWFVGQVHAIN